MPCCDFASNTENFKMVVYIVSYILYHTPRFSEKSASNIQYHTYSIIHFFHLIFCIILSQTFYHTSSLEWGRDGSTPGHSTPQSTPAQGVEWVWYTTLLQKQWIGNWIGFKMEWSVATPIRVNSFLKFRHLPHTVWKLINKIST